MAAKPAAKPLVLMLVLLAALHALSACVPLVITAATVTAVDVNLDRRTAGKYLDDNALELKLRSGINNDPALGRDINVSVTAFNGSVLLTGEVNSEAQRMRAVELAESYRETGEVAKVVDGLTLAGKTNLFSRLNDSWITSKVKARLFKSEGLPASAVKVVTEHGKVYLLGKVTRAEAETAVESIRDINGITHIVKVFEYTD